MLGGDVGHPAGYVLDHDLEVLLPLARTQLLVDEGRLGVDHDRLDRLGVEAIQGVGERAVAPETPHRVQLDQQAGEGVEHLVAAQSKTGTLEELPVGEGVVLVTSDERGGLFGARILVTSLDQPNRHHGRRPPGLQGPEHLVVSPGGGGGHLLDRVHALGIRDESDYMA